MTQGPVTAVRAAIALLPALVFCSAGLSEGLAQSSRPAGRSALAASLPAGIPACDWHPPPAGEARGSRVILVDQQAPGATDQANPLGEPQRPRLTIPQDLQAGSVVRVRGAYALRGGDHLAIRASGEPSRPVYLTSWGPGRASIQCPIRLTGSHAVFEALEFTAGGKLTVLAPADHVVVRECEIHHTPGTGIAVCTWTPGPSVASNVLIAGNHIHHLGHLDAQDAFAKGEFDAHGVLCSAMARRVWILDNDIHHVQGDCVQLSRSKGKPDQGPAEQVYIARNRMHDTGEEALDIKLARDVIAAENLMHGFVPTALSGVGGGAGGAAVILHDDGKMGEWQRPMRVSIIANLIGNCQYGVRIMSGEEITVRGNVLRQVREMASTGHSADSPWKPGCAIQAVGSDDIRILANRMVDCERGICLRVVEGMRVSVRENVIGEVEPASGVHLLVKAEGKGASVAMARAEIGGNLFFQTAGAVRVLAGRGAGPAGRWGREVATPDLAGWPSLTGVLPASPATLHNP